MKWTVLLLLAAMACHPAATDEDDVEKPPAKKEEKKEPIGIVTAALLPAANAQPQLLGYATVVDLSELFASASQYAAADAQRQQAAAHLQSTNAELARQRLLNADDHNISDRAVQETAAAAATDAAAVRAAEASVHAAENAARQRWGAVLAHGVIADAPWARGLASGDTAVLEVAFNGDGPPPATVRVQARTARYLAAAPRVNARLLRASHYYLASPASEFPVGLSIDLYGSPATANGVVVPAAAVVWVNGAATVFVEDRPSHYAPHTIGAATHVPGGYVETSLPAGTRVVVQGAQQLAAE
jgi:multidrug efflux system membrane fusion protein